MLKVILPVLLVVIGFSIAIGSFGALFALVSSLQKYISNSDARPSHKFKDLAHDA